MKKINKILFKPNHKENNPKLPHPSPNTSANYCILALDYF